MITFISLGGFFVWGLVNMNSVRTPDQRLVVFSSFFRHRRKTPLSFYARTLIFVNTCITYVCMYVSRIPVTIKNVCAVFLRGLTLTQQPVTQTPCPMTSYQIIFVLAVIPFASATGPRLGGKSWCGQKAGCLQKSSRVSEGATA